MTYGRWGSDRKVFLFLHLVTLGNEKKHKVLLMHRTNMYRHMSNLKQKIYRFCLAINFFFVNQSCSAHI